MSFDLQINFLSSFFFSLSLSPASSSLKCAFAKQSKGLCTTENTVNESITLGSLKAGVYETQDYLFIFVVA